MTTEINDTDFSDITEKEFKTKNSNKSVKVINSSGKELINAILNLMKSRDKPFQLSLNKSNDLINSFCGKNNSINNIKNAVGRVMTELDNSLISDKPYKEYEIVKSIGYSNSTFKFKNL